MGDIHDLAAVAINQALQDLAAERDSLRQQLAGMNTVLARYVTRLRSFIGADRPFNVDADVAHAVRVEAAREAVYEAGWRIADDAVDCEDGGQTVERDDVNRLRDALSALDALTSERKS